MLNIYGYILKLKKGGSCWSASTQISVDSARSVTKDHQPAVSRWSIVAPLGEVAAAVAVAAVGRLANWTPSVRFLGGMPHLWHGLPASLAASAAGRLSLLNVLPPKRQTDNWTTGQMDNWTTGQLDNSTNTGPAIVSVI